MSIGAALVFEISTHFGVPPASVPSTTSEMISCAWAVVEHRANAAAAPKSFRDDFMLEAFLLVHTPKGRRVRVHSRASDSRWVESVLSPGGWAGSVGEILKDIRALPRLV